jgi:Uma2 family endonuclease
MAVKRIKKSATYADLCDLPDRFIAEILDGDLYGSPRRALPHAHAASALGALLGLPFFVDQNGPGGWVILDQPEVHFGGDVLVPDLAGWRRDRMPRVPDAAYFTPGPDWVCELLSPATEALDRGKKLRIYAREGVAHAWLVDPTLRTLEIWSLTSQKLALTQTYEGTAPIRAVPFEAVELDLGALWI